MANIARIRPDRVDAYVDGVYISTAVCGQGFWKGKVNEKILLRLLRQAIRERDVTLYLPLYKGVESSRNRTR